MRVRLLPWSVADGATLMAEDEAMLDSAIGGVASLRFYGWSEPTLSLGYFQPSAPARAYPGLGALPWLRRASGGAALVHHHELTYALALPPDLAAGSSWVVRMHDLVRLALSRLGVEASLCVQEAKLGEVLCFLHHTPGDLLLCGHKVAGSAQRKRRGALLQHGGILLGQSEHTAELPGIAEISGRAVSCDDLRGLLAESLGAQPGGWTDAERESLPSRIQQRYGSPAWNAKR